MAVLGAGALRREHHSRSKFAALAVHENTTVGGVAATKVRIYVAQLAGTAIFDPNGDQVGRVSDIVVRILDSTADSDRGIRAPRVLGIVAEIQAFRRIFISMGRVTSIDSGAVVLSTGTLNLRKFATRPGETLVIGELLDRRVTITSPNTGSAVTAETVDVAMEADKSVEWTLSHVAVRERTGRLSRRGQLRQLPWEEVSGLTAAPSTQGTANLLSATEDLLPADLANMVRDLPLRRRVELANALDDERLADLLEEMPGRDQVELLYALSRDRAAEVLGAMDPDDAADLLNSLPSTDKVALLDLMEPAEAVPVRQLLSYRPGIAGAIMTNEPIILPPDATVAEALALIRQVEQPPALAAQVFVCRAPTATPTGRYLGIAHFQRLLREPPSELLAACIDTDVDPIDPQLPLVDITRRLATYDLVALAVVNDDKLIGAVTVDDVLDHMLPTDWRDRSDA